MQKVIRGIVVASISLFAVSAAFACDPMGKDQPCAKHFEEMDANHDGAISKKEFDAYHSKHFKELDTNHDGKLTQEEMQAAYPRMHGHGDALISKRFEAADANHDGALTKEEAKEMPMLSKHFDEIDANKDGKVTPEELKAMMDERRGVAVSAPTAATADGVTEKK